MIRSFIKISFRRVLRHPAYSIINIAGMVVGLLCFIVIMLWVKHELSYDKFHKNADRLYRVAFTNEQGDYHGYMQTGTLAGYLKEKFPEIIHSTSFNGGQCKVAYQNKGYYCTGSYADSSFFSMFTFPFINGDKVNALKLPYSLVITKSLSLKLFGSEDPIGKVVTLNEGIKYTVRGLIEDVPRNSQMKFDLLMPFCDTQEWMKTWNSKWTQTYVMLQNIYQFENVNKKISGVMDIFQPEWKNILYLAPFTKSHLNDLNGGGLILYVWIFSIMACIVLLLACINFMNLSTSRSELRYKEIFIKRINGSKRLQISVQFLSEALILSFVALGVAVILAKFALPEVNNLLHTNLHLTFNAATLAALFLIAFLTGIIAGGYPALYLARIKPGRIIKKSSQTKGWGIVNFKYFLVVFQFAISVFFISCTLLVANQIRYLHSKNLGIQKENVIKLSTLGKLNEKSIELKQELLKNSAIENITISNTDLTSWNNSGPLEWEGKNKNDLTEIGYNWVDYDFLQTFKLKMKEGRFFSEDFRLDQANSFIINEKAVSYLGLKNPVGRKVKSWFGVEGTIIGVIEDFHTTSLHDELGPIALLAANRGNYMFIAVNGREMAKTIKFIETKVKEIVPDDPFEYQFLDDHINYLYQTEALTSKLSIILTILAIFISCLGLWGLALSTLQQRTKEIGIRTVNGAAISEIMFLLNKDIVKWVAVACIIAIPIAWYTTYKWLQNFAYKIELSWWIFILAGVIALVIALITVSWQSYKAATQNPVEALRYE